MPKLIQRAVGAIIGDELLFENWEIRENIDDDFEINNNASNAITIQDSTRLVTIKRNLQIDGDVNGDIDFTGNVVVNAAKTITGTLIGNADTATLASTVTVADTTDTSCSVALFESATGNLSPKTDGGLTYNASTGLLTATSFSGTTTLASTVTITDTTADTNYDVVFGDSTSTLYDDTGTLTYNPSSGLLTTKTASISGGGVKIKQAVQTGITSGVFYEGLSFENVGTTHAFGLGYNSGGQFAINYFDGSSAYSNLLTIKGSTGMVGIGTDDPTAKFDVTDLTAGTGDIVNLIRPNLADGQTCFLHLGQDLSTNNAALFAYSHSTGSLTQLSIGFYNDGGLLCIVEGGNIGVGGATSPTIDLAIGDDDTGLHQASANELTVYTGGSERMRFDSSGNVGINTNNPHQKLHVNGNIYLGDSDSEQFVHCDGNVAFSSDGAVLIVSDANDTAGFGSGDIIFGCGSAVDANANPDTNFNAMYPSDVPRNEFMRIKATDGNVEIQNSLVVGDENSIPPDRLITDFQAAHNDNTTDFIDVPWINTRCIENWDERGTAGSALMFGNSKTDGTNDKISLITNGVTQLLVENNDVEIRADLDVGGDINVTDGSVNLGTNGYFFSTAPGVHLKTQILTDADLTFTNTSTTSSSWTEIVGASANYTPYHNHSYVIIEAFFRYVVNGTAGDIFYSRITVGATTIQEQEQDWNNGSGGGTRSQCLFPIKGRYTNSSASTLNVDIDFKGSSDDTCTINTSHCWIQYTEISRE